MRMDAEGPHSSRGGPLDDHRQRFTLTSSFTAPVRTSAPVAIHNHPRWATIWAGVGREPAYTIRRSALYHGKGWWPSTANIGARVDDATNARAVME